MDEKHVLTRSLLLSEIRIVSEGSALGASFESGQRCPEGGSRVWPGSGASRSRALPPPGCRSPSRAFCCRFEKRLAQPLAGEAVPVPGCHFEARCVREEGRLGSAQLGLRAPHSSAGTGSPCARRPWRAPLGPAPSLRQRFGPLPRLPVSIRTY